MLTASTMMPLGTEAPDFSLLDVVTGGYQSLSDLQSEVATVIFFICNHCPYVIHIQDKLVEIAKFYIAKGVSFVAISANDEVQYPADAPDKMAQVAQQCGFCFPYLYDKTQAVAKAYQAACTPDFYIFDAGLRCVYRGRFDAATPGNQQPVTGLELTNALDALLAGEEPALQQHPSMGCNIKWRS